MKKNSFYALLLRMKHISRWVLMRNNTPENLSEHSLETAIIAHSLALIDNKYFDACANAEKIATAALFHDASEILTGDLPTPVKYNNPAIRTAYKALERGAKESLLCTLPAELQPDYSSLLMFEENNPREYLYIKAADKICAYLKCIDERKSGNTEFKSAAIQLLDAINALDFAPANYFLAHFVPAFELTLDEQQKSE